QAGRLDDRPARKRGRRTRRPRYHRARRSGLPHVSEQQSKKKGASAPFFLPRELCQQAEELGALAVAQACGDATFMPLDPPRSPRSRETPPAAPGAAGSRGAAAGRRARVVRVRASFLSGFGRVAAIVHGIELRLFEESMAYAISLWTPPALSIAGSAEQFPVRRIFCVGRNYAEHQKEM